MSLATLALETARAFYASEIQAVANLKSEALVAALATVPRERFLDQGPWQVFSDGSGGGYYSTPDSNPLRVYHNVAVALNPKRLLNNGQPSLLASWIDQLAIRPGYRVAHIGCATGYFTALLAELVGHDGIVSAFEIDKGLAARARKCLSGWPQVEVNGDGTQLSGTFNAILVNAGVTHPMSNWLDALADGGRMILPLTADMGGPAGKGWTIRLARRRDRFEAVALGMVAIYHCVGARSPAMAPLLQKAFMSWGSGEVRQLRREVHQAESTCWLHADGWCLSKLAL